MGHQKKDTLKGVSFFVARRAVFPAAAGETAQTRRLVWAAYALSFREFLEMGSRFKADWAVIVAGYGR